MDGEMQTKCILHVIQASGPEPPVTWCGRTVDTAEEPVLYDLNGAAHIGATGGHPHACPTCVATAIDALTRATT